VAEILGGMCGSGDPSKHGVGPGGAKLPIFANSVLDRVHISAINQSINQSFYLPILTF